MWRFLLSVVFVCIVGAATAVAQDMRQWQNSGILIIDSERLFQETALGQSVQKRLDKDRESLLLENQELDRELIAEEASLAEKRSTMDAGEFRILADAFNDKVENIRTTQEAKQQDIASRYEEDRQRFFSMILPALGQIVNERNGRVVLERRDVFLSAEEVDITNDVIERINTLSEEMLAVPNATDPANSRDENAQKP